MVGVEDGAGPVDVEVVDAALAPRDLEHGVEPVADPPVLDVLLGRALEAVDLAGDRLPRGLGDRAGLDQLLQPLAVALDRVFLVLAELLADGVHLLAEQELALAVLEALGDVVADLLGQLVLGQGVLGPLAGRGSTSG